MLWIFGAISLLSTQHSFVSIPLKSLWRSVQKGYIELLVSQPSNIMVTSFTRDYLRAALVSIRLLLVSLHGTVAQGLAAAVRAVSWTLVVWIRHGCCKFFWKLILMKSYEYILGTFQKIKSDSRNLKSAVDYGLLASEACDEFATENHGTRSTSSSQAYHDPLRLVYCLHQHLPSGICNRWGLENLWSFCCHKETNKTHFSLFCLYLRMIPPQSVPQEINISGMDIVCICRWIVTKFSRKSQKGFAPQFSKWHPTSVNFLRFLDRVLQKWIERLEFHLIPASETQLHTLPREDLRFGAHLSDWKSVRQLEQECVKALECNEYDMSDMSFL